MTPLRKQRLLRFVFFLLVAILSAAASLAVVFKNETYWLLEHLPLIRRFFYPTTARQIALYGAAARSRLQPIFHDLAVAYPPEKVVLIAIKGDEKLLVYASDADGRYRYICRYPILGASGHLGPKLKEGDMQVPEGIYQLTLEPNTPYHVALRLNYPNESDLKRAQADGRNTPGSDILIHGTTGSVGCIAMGDPASEDLFVLVHDTKTKQAQLIIAPYDLRDHAPPPAAPEDPSWLPDLYREIKNAMTPFPRTDKVHE